MTVGPDLDWLADPQGNIQPDIARAIAETPDRPAALLPAAAPAPLIAEEPMRAPEARRAAPRLEGTPAPVATAPRMAEGPVREPAVRTAVPPLRPAAVRPPVVVPRRMRQITIPVPDLATLGQGVPSLAVIAIVAIISGAVGAMMSGRINQSSSGSAPFPQHCRARPPRRPGPLR